MSDSLTFGIELEFLVVYRCDAFTNSLPGLVPTQGEQIAEDGNISAGHAIHFWLGQENIPAEGRWDPGFLNPTYQKWHVHADENELSAAERNVLPGGYIHESVEISSRKLRFTDDWETELNQVLEVLQRVRKHFGCELITNDTTGLHVHIGNVNGHEVQTVKRLAQIATAHERCLDRLHNTDRIKNAQPNAGAMMPLFAGMSFFHWSSEYERPTGWVLDWIMEIEKKENFRELGDLCRVPFRGDQLQGHCSALNLDNLYPDPDRRNPSPPTGTVEFRQHAGTLDSIEIVAYIWFLVYLTAFCQEAGDVEFVSLMAHSLDTAFDLPELLETIQCEEDVFEHFTHPRSPSSPVDPNPELLPLLAVNNRETAARMNPDNVQAAIDRKIDAGLYSIGFDPMSGGFVPFGPSHFTWMLSCAQADISQLPGPRYNVESKARQIVFAKLANIYADQDVNLTDDEDKINQIAVRNELMPWVNRYGDLGQGMI